MNTIALQKNQTADKKWGFSSCSLKILALFLMTLDHIYVYLGDTLFSVPHIFTLLGRISAPLFLFAMAEGFSHTHNRLSYLKRLYIASVLMSIGNLLINTYLPHPKGAMVINGMFATLFVTGLYIWGIELLAASIRQKKWKKAFLPMTMLLVPVFSGITVLGIMNSPLSQTSAAVIQLLFILVPSPVFVEGSVCWVILGIGFYFFRNHKVRLSLFYILVSALFLLSAASKGMTYENLFILNDQWFMILSLPFMLLYNGTRGKKLKYFFYAYYPLHVYLLVILARVLA